MIIKSPLLLLAGVFVPIFSFGQINLSINGQYMNRAEYRHGFSTLASSQQEAAFFISQRARLMTSLKFEKAEIYVSIQDIRTWGNTANATVDNTGLLSVHEAWVAIQLSNKMKIKMGRQEIAYDEDRIFGNLDWAMQARRHDAAIVKYYDSASNTTLDLGVSFNQEKEQLAGTVYTIPNNYKTFQYMYLSKAFGKLKSSFLFLNNGIQITKPNTAPTEYTTVFTQTFGPRLSYKEREKKLSGNASFYYQLGTNNQNRSLSAYNFIGEVAYQLSTKFALTSGLEILSGTDELNSNPNESESFNPLYGTNHRFNGYQDYFYVGNHINSVGLQDFYVKGLLTGSKVFYGIALHFFSAPATIQDDLLPGTAASKRLGTELDVTFSYNISSGISLQGGYSQMFATKSLEFLKDVAEGSKQVNNWAYVMFIVRPGTAWPKTGLKL